MERKNDQRKETGGKTRGKAEKMKSIGLDVGMPKKKCEDRKCPFHGHLKIRGRTFTGEILTKDTHRTAVVGWQRMIKIPKYERYAKRRTKIKVHNPGCINADVGERVTIVECRPLSKSKSFVIVEKAS